MIIKQVPRSLWEAKLRRWGCSPLDGKGPLNTAEWWIGKRMLPFTVPVDDDGACEFWALQKICEQNGIDPNDGNGDTIKH